MTAVALGRADLVPAPEGPVVFGDRRGKGVGREVNRHEGGNV